MTLLVDYSYARPSPAAIKAAGYAGVMRYLTGAGKAVATTEIAALHAAGLAVGFVYEGDGPTRTTRALEGYAAGQEDGRTALTVATALGIPPTVCLYFAVDTDTTADKVAAYFQGVASVLLGRPAGVYGSYQVVDGTVRAGLAAYGWQTVAWSAGKVSAVACLYQRNTHPGPPIAGSSPADTDEDAVLQADWGGWAPDTGGVMSGLTRTDMTTIAARTGYPVRAAWTTGHGAMGTVQGIMLHHTATSASAPGDYPSLGIVTRGRSDLPGPLCNYGLGRSGTIYLVTEGIAWHAGVGYYNGVADGNGHFLGVEAENPGTGAPWPAAQLDAYRRLVASTLNYLGLNTDWDVRHADFATPAGRKTDTAGFNMQTDFDPFVKTMLANPPSINRNWRPAGPVTPTPAPAPKGPLMALSDAEQAELLAKVRQLHGAAYVGDAKSWLYHHLYRPLRYGDNGPGTAKDGQANLSDIQHPTG